MDYQILSGSVLFEGVSLEELHQLITCLRPENRTYKKGKIIYHAGTQNVAMGLVLSGCVHIEHNDLLGNKSILNQILPGEIFAETYACMKNEELLVNVTAAEDSDILFFDVRQVLNLCADTCLYHMLMIQNLLFVMARKNLALSKRCLHTAPKRIRERLLSYFSEQMARQGGRSFTIPFGRQELADYLNVDRSALSNELSKMSREGMIRIQKNKVYYLGEDLLF
ncbi:MAG: Crp/Fnr family transcriptional regulator [Lachnospiraceae bacterium]|nr:Crp/Fnr family transcriptional regulator [Lachnospiraceae bacterium]